MNKLVSRLLKNEVISYIIFGVLTTLVNFICYLLMTNIDINYKIANVVAFVVSITFAFITNKFIVFKSNKVNTKTIISEIGLFFTSRITTFGIDIISMIILVEYFEINHLVSKIIVNIIVILLNYILSKLVVFKKEKYNNKLSL